MVAYVVGKPVAVARHLLADREAQPRALRPPVGWAAVAGAGTIAGVGLHRRGADRHAGLRRRGARRGQARHPRRGARASLITWILFRVTSALPRRAPGDGLCSASAEQLVDLTATSIPSATTSAGPTMRWSPSSNTATSSARTADGRSPRARAPGGRRDVRFVWRAPAAERRAPAGAARCRGGGGGRRPGRLLADARPDARPPGRAHRVATWSATRSRSVSTSSRFRDDLRTHSIGRADRRGRRHRRRQRGRRAPPPSSSTGGATTAPTTSPRCRPPSARRAHARRCAPRTETTLGDGMSAVDPITPEVLIPQPHELVTRHGAPDTIAGWKALADGLLTDQPCVFHRNLEISSRYAWIYKYMPAYLKWAGMAAFASHHVRLALFPLRLDRDRTGYVDIPHSLGRRRVLLISDVNTIRETNNAIFDDIFWVHLAYATAEDGIECLRDAPASRAPLRPRPRRLRGDRPRTPRPGGPTASGRGAHLEGQRPAPRARTARPRATQPRRPLMRVRPALLDRLGPQLRGPRPPQRDVVLHLVLLLRAHRRDPASHCTRRHGRESPATTTAGAGS